MLSTDEIVQMRTLLEESLPETVTVRRRTIASDGAGGYSESWATVTVAGRVSPGGLSPQEQAIAERLSSVQTWTITLPALTDVNTKDQLLVGSRTFEVVGVLGPRTYEVLRRVIAVEVL